ncbi:hypothetical protein [Methanocalculus sp.]|uniref:hypothetical protein n=1 Tax=Methanocalculus sp. TaxID=2004547 RepID=UPI0027167221|nr:hypothetical protein [Methanocalculus sp.]MDO8842401.1 hypothetical protein [Methanocalculus sp.]
MEDSVQQTFRIKFIKIVILLNIFIFTLAGAVLIFLIVPSGVSFKIPAVLVLSIIAVASGLISRREYISTKQWLDLHGKSV